MGGGGGLAKMSTASHQFPMRLLVIGGTGFIGQRLVPQLLEAGHTVGVLQRPGGEGRLPAGAEAMRVDRRDLLAHTAALRGFAPDVVIDLILSSGRQAAELMEVFAGHARRIVAVTSADVYRATSVLHGLESGPLEPVPLTEDSALRMVAQTYPPAQIEALKHVIGWLDDDYDKVAVERALRARADTPVTTLPLPMI